MLTGKRSQIHSFAVRSLSTLVILLALTLGTHAAAAIDFSKPVAFDIPAQPLSTALVRFSDQAGVQFTAPATSLDRLTTQGVRGQYAPTAALRIMLRNTGLTYRVVDARTVAISRPQPASAETPSAPAESAGKEGKTVTSGRFRLARAHHEITASPAAVTPESGSPNSAQTGLQEIVVTAERRRDRLLDAPASISVLSSATLSELGAVQFRDFASTVPGLSFTTTGAGYTQITLRGVTSGFFPGSTVAIYVDDVPYGSSSAFAQAAQLSLDVGLFDIDRIDVLRGPQGTLYGASAMGGLIKYVTTPPNTTRFGGEVRAELSDTEDGRPSYTGDIVLNDPLIPDKAALRASLYYNRDGGYVDNLALHQSDVNRSSIYGGRLEFLATPTDRLRVRITGFLQNISRAGDATNDYGISGVPLYGPLDQYRLTAEPFEQQFRLVSANVDYDLSFASLTSVTSYQTVRTQVSHDLSGAYLPILSSIGLDYGGLGFPIDYFTDKFTQELRLTSRRGRLFDWLAGTFYTHETSGNYQVFAPLTLTGTPAPNILYTYSAPSIFEEAAAYGDLTFHLTRQLDATGGLRYARNDQTYTQYGSGLLIASEPSRTSTDHVLTYLANARYRLTSNAAAYVRFATGYRPGGPNAVANDPLTGRPLAPPTFGPDRLRSYEAGFKAQTPGGALSMDLDGYYIDWSNIQISAVRNGFGVISNAPGGATVRGAELSVSARAAAAVTVTGAFAYQDPRLSQASADLGATEGERLPNVPPFTAALNAEYRIMQSGLKPSLGATLEYVGARDASFDKNASLPQYALPSYTNFDLHAGLDVSSVHIQVFIHNLFNTRGQLSAFTGYSAPGTAAVALLRPRTIGVSATEYF